MTSSSAVSGQPWRAARGRASGRAGRYGLQTPRPVSRAGRVSTSREMAPLKARPREDTGPARRPRPRAASRRSRRARRARSGGDKVSAQMSGAPVIAKRRSACQRPSSSALPRKRHEGDRLGPAVGGVLRLSAERRGAEAGGEPELGLQGREVVERRPRGLVAVVEDEGRRHGREHEAHRGPGSHRSQVAQRRAVGVVHLEDERFACCRGGSREAEAPLFTHESGLGQAQPVERRFAEHLLLGTAGTLARPRSEPHAAVEGGVVAVELQRLQGEPGVETVTARPRAGHAAQGDLVGATRRPRRGAARTP